ncbi:heme peroxidase [Mycena leptocephala]|nr:heme peroxidase [Mycena leptocephala]
MAVENCGGPVLEFRGGRVVGKRPEAASCSSPPPLWNAASGLLSHQQPRIPSNYLRTYFTTFLHAIDALFSIAFHTLRPGSTFQYLYSKTTLRLTDHRPYSRTYVSGFLLFHSVDTVAPNKPGVPELQDTLESHTAAFARQNFTATEMIGLVACGHTFGGVQNVPFPQIAPVLNDPTNTESVAHFDTTFTHLDNDIATEYISGTTKKSLVVGLNDITNSDKRIFGSDGNATMLSFANSADLSASTCADLFAKMLNTVPQDVQLTEVITPLPVKPDYLHFNLDSNSLRFSTQVRFRELPNTTYTMLMLWDDRAGGSNNVTLIPSNVVTAAGGRFTASWFDTPLLTLDVAAGITNMRFLPHLVSRRILTRRNTRLRLAPTRVYLETPGQDNISRPIIVETDLQAQPAVANATFNIWSIELDGNFDDFTIGAEVGGVKITRGDSRPVQKIDVCP